MSRTVDTRTVEMRFDNKNFESNVKQSMSTLDKLKQKLKLDGASKGLEEVEKKSKKLEFKDLDRSIDNVGKKFSALETIATGAFLRIGMKAADAGMKMVKSFTVDQVSAGWDKYAEKTTAVQTIMANLKDDASKFIDEASKMDYVNRYLDKLMWFSDETSYSFTDMTGNVGKFIANGQDLEESVTAMQGIATWAAMSGQNAQTASRAMYNISQAMGTGSMKIKDWMSIENANMATAQFKELAIAIGQKQGKIKQGAVTVESFRESLSGSGTNGWFDKDVMMEVFETYGEAANRIQEYAKSHKVTSTEAIREIKKQDESFADSIGFKAFAAAQEAKTFGEVISATADAASTKWLNFFENIFGNYLEAKELWTNLSEDLYDIFVEPLNGLNEIASIWKTGFKINDRDILADAYLRGDLDNLYNSYGVISDAAAEAAVEAAKADESIYREIETLSDGSRRLVTMMQDSSGEYKYYVKEIFDADKHLLSGREVLLEGFRNLMNVFLLDWEDEEGKEHLSVLGALKKAFMEVFFPDLASAEDGGKKSIAERLFELTKKFRDFTEKLKPLGDKLKNIFKGFFTVVNLVRKFIIALIKPFKNLFSNLFGEVPDGVLGFADSISTWVQEFDKFLEENKVFEKVSEGVKTGIDAISGALDWLSQTLTGLPIKELTGLIKNKVVEFFKNYDFKGHFENIGKFFSDIIGQIRQVEADDLPDKLTPLQNFWIGFKKIWEGIKKFFGLISVPFKKIGEFISNFFSGLSESIGGKQTEKSASKFQPIWEGIKSVFQGIVDFFEKISPALEKIGSWLGEKLSGIGDAIGEFAKNHDAKEIIEWVLKGGFIASLTDFFFSISKVFGGTGGILKSIKKDLDAVRGVLKSYQAEINASTILEVAMAIGILAGSLWVLAQIPSDKLGQAGDALLKIAGAVAGFSLLKDVFHLISNLRKKTDTGKALTGEGGPLAGIKNILTSVVSTSIFANDATAKFVKICLGILLAALAILTVVKAMTKVADAFQALADIPPEVIEKGGKVMAQVMVAFGAFAMLAGTANRSSSALFAALAALILVFAIKNLINVIAELGSDSEKMKNVRAAVDNFKDVFKAVARLAKIVVGIALGLAIIQTVIVAFASLGKQSSLGVSQVLKQFGKTFIRIALSLVIVAAAIAILSGVSKNMSSDSWDAISSFLILFVAVTGILEAVSIGLASFGKRSGKNTADLMKQFGKNFIRIAASMLIIAAAFAIFKLINLDLGTLIVVGLLFAAIGTIITILTKFAADMATKQKHLYFLENLKGIGNLFLKIAFALILVAAAFAAFSVIGHYFGTKTLKIASWIFSIFAIIGLLLTWIATANATGEKGGAASAKSAAFVKNLKAISLVFVALAGSLLIVAGAFAVMSSLNFDKTPIWQIGIVFGAFMILTGLFSVALGKWLKDNNLEKTLYGLAAYVVALAGALVVVAAAFKIMDSLKMKSGAMWRVFGIFSLLMVVMGGIALLTAKFVANDKLVKTLLGLSVYVLALSASMVVIAAAFKIMDSLKMNRGAMWRTFGIFAILLVVIGAIGIVAGKLLTEATSWVSIALMAGLMITAAGFLYLASLAIAKIADAVPLNKMQGVLDILIVLGSILAIMGIIGVVAGASELGSVGLAAMAVLLIAFGAACWLASKGIEVLFEALSKNGEEAAKNMILISASMKQMLKDFGDSFGNVMLIVLTIALLGPAAAIAGLGLIVLAIPIAVITSLLIALIAAVTDFINTFSIFVDVVSDKGSEFVQNISSVLNSLLDTIIETGPKLEASVYTVITALVNGISLGILNNLETVITVITAAIYAIANALMNNAYIIRYAVVTVIMQLIMGILDALADNIDPLMASLVNFIEQLAVAVENNLGPLIEAGKDLGKALLRGLFSGLTGIKFSTPLKIGISEGRLTISTSTGSSASGTASSVASMLMGSGQFGTGLTGESALEEKFLGKGKSSTKKIGKNDGKNYGEAFVSSIAPYVEQIKSGFSETLNIETIKNGFSEILNVENIKNGFSGFLGSMNFGGLTSPFGTQKEKSELDLAYERGELDALDNKYKTVTASAAEAAVEVGRTGNVLYREIETLSDGSRRLLTHTLQDNGTISISTMEIYEEQTNSLQKLIESFSDPGEGLSTITPIMDGTNLENYLSNLFGKEYTVKVTPQQASAAAYDVNSATTPVVNQETYTSNDTYNNTFNITSPDTTGIKDEVLRALTAAYNRKQALYGR